MNLTSRQASASARDDDLAAAAALLAVFFSHAVTQRAVIDTPLEHVGYEAVTAIAMLAIANRTRVGFLGLPVAPPRFRQLLPLIKAHRAVELFSLTSITVALAVLVRGSERAAAVIWPPAVMVSGSNVEVECRSYNDPGCTGDSATVDVIEVLTASVGEELAYRFALLIIIARFTSVRIAIVAQAAIWALGHTGFEQGYGAATTVGLFAVGLVYAVSVLGTGSIWPAIVAHALHNLGVAAFDHDLTVVVWIVLGVNGLSAVVLAFAVSMPVAKFVTRRR